MNVLSIIVLVGAIAFFIYELVGVIKDIKNKKANKKSDKNIDKGV